MSEINFCEVVDAVCKRPKMYTPTGSFFEVVSFLEGYGSIATAGEYAAHSAFTRFHKWLFHKLEVNEPISDWIQFREMFNSDSDALTNLSIFYKQYVDTL